MSVRLRWGAGRIGILPDAFSTSISYVAVVSARHARPTLSCTTLVSRTTGNSVSDKHKVI
eukprot:185806-Prymnesium_polylepis.1